MFWHAGFPLVVMAYALAQGPATAHPSAGNGWQRQRRAILGGWPSCSLRCRADVLVDLWLGVCCRRWWTSNVYTTEMTYVSTGLWML